MADTLKPISMGPFLGMNNRLPDTQLRTKDGTFLRNAVNVDVNTAGYVKRRHGSALAVAGTDCHSFWSNALGTLAFYVDYNTLYQLHGTPGALTATALIAGLTPGMPMSYADLNADVYCTNGATINRITAGAVFPQALPTPAALPSPVTSTGGALKAGLYSFTITYATAAGEESGAPFPLQVAVPEGGILTLSGFPSGAALVNLYMSPLNGDEYYFVAQLVGGTASYAITTPVAFGRRCMTIGLAPMPPGQIIRVLNGRIFVAIGSMLYYSEAYSPLYDPARNFVPFPLPITVMQDVNNGLYVCSDQTYWIKGDILDAELNPVLPYGGILGTAGYIPTENSVFWMSPRGLVKGTQEGEVTNLQEKTNAVNSGIIGASLFRESDGLKQLLTTLFGSQTGSTFAADSWMSADIVRKGTTL